MNDQVYNISQFDEGQFKTLLYVPSSLEICNIENLVDSGSKAEARFPPRTMEPPNENDLEAPIREIMTKSPTIVKSYKGFKTNNDFSRDGILASNFKEAYNYRGKVYKLLVYLTLVHNIFQLEYSI